MRRRHTSTASASPRRPRDLGEFVTWIEHMNADMLAAGVELGDRYDFDLVHGHDWLVAVAGDHLANRFRCPLVTTIHATEYGRHQGWVDKHPQCHIHGVERWITNRAERVIACSHYMREHVADIFGVDEERVSVIPNGIDPMDLQPGRRPRRRCAPRSPRPTRSSCCWSAGSSTRRASSSRSRRCRADRRAPGNVRFLVAGSGTHEAGAARRRPTELGPDGARHVPRLDRRRRPALALPDRRPLRRARRSTSRSASSRSRRWPAAARASSPTPAACARSCPHGDGRPALHARATPSTLGEMVERVLTDDELRERLVAEASEHVLRFDWADVARQTAASTTP